MRKTVRYGQVTLAIETAIGAGGVSLLCGQDELASSNGGVSRAEEVLTGIERVIAEAAATLADVDLIAVSIGPGSFTGIRVGIATALGIRTSLNVRCVGVSSLKAMSISSSKGTCICVLPLGRGNYAAQEFSADNTNEQSKPFVIREQELSTLFGERSDVKFLLHADANVDGPLPANVVSCPDVLATLIGRSAFAGNGNETLEPLYLRKE